MLWKSYHIWNIWQNIILHYFFICYFMVLYYFYFLHKPKYYITFQLASSLEFCLKAFCTVRNEITPLPLYNIVTLSDSRKPWSRSFSTVVPVTLNRQTAFPSVFSHLLAFSYLWLFSDKVKIHTSAYFSPQAQQAFTGTQNSSYSEWYSSTTVPNYSNWPEMPAFRSLFLQINFTQETNGILLEKVVLPVEVS